MGATNSSHKTVFWKNWKVKIGRKTQLYRIKMDVLKRLAGINLNEYNKHNIKASRVKNVDIKDKKKIKDLNKHNLKLNYYNDLQQIDEKKQKLTKLKSEKLNDSFSLPFCRHFFMYCNNEKEKFDVLCNIYNSIINFKTVIFCKNYDSSNELVKKLQNIGCSVAYNVNTSMKNKVINNFITIYDQIKTGVVVATFESARNLHSFSFVIFYEMPNNRDFLRKCINVIKKETNNITLEKCGIISFIGLNDLSHLMAKYYRVAIPKSFTDYSNIF